MGILRKRLGSWLFCAFVSIPCVQGCAREPTALTLTNDQLGVFSILRAGSDSATVFVIKYPPEANPFRIQFEPVSGAHVQFMNVAGDTVRLIEQSHDGEICANTILDSSSSLHSDQSGCYRGRIPGGITPGKKYSIRITASGVSARGSAVIPGRAEFLEPKRNAIIPVVAGFHADENQLRIRWDQPAVTARLELIIEPLVPHCNIAAFGSSHGIANNDGGPGIHVRGTSVILTDATSNDLLLTSVRFLCENNRGGPVPFDSLSARMILAVYDTAYARYAKEVFRAGSILLMNGSPGLTGAFGVFGAVAISERHIVFVAQN